jgi:hypothetical protein
LNLEWTTSRDAVGDYYWTLRLPNGWTAMVADHSHATKPERMPKYTAAASSRMWHRSLPELFDMLADAKGAALSFALRQEAVAA